MNVNGFELGNGVKLERARTIIGPDASDEEMLVEYDRLGGLITKAGQKVKSGCFYDVKAKKAAVKPKIIFLYAVNGRIVEVPEGTELPGEVRAANILAEEEKKKLKPAKKTKKDDADAEEESDSEDE